MAENNLVNSPFPTAVAKGGTAVTSVTTVPAPTAFAGWDANLNMSADSFIAGYATTATGSGGGTTTLTVASKQQQYFTGTLTQTVVLPLVSTLVLGQNFIIVNNSTGNVTVQSSGGNTIQVMTQNTQMIVTCILTSGTTASSWNNDYQPETIGVSSITGTSNQITASASSGPVTLSLPASVQIDTSILGSNSHAMMTLTDDAAAVNHFNIQNSATGAPVRIVAEGTDTAINMVIGTKGAGGTVAIFGELGAQPGILSLWNAGANNFLSLNTPAGLASYGIVFPAAQGGAHSTLLNDGAGNLSWAASINSINVQTFTSNGTYTPTAGMVYCIVRAVGAGSGGGGATTTVPINSASVGLGGAAGAYAEGLFSAATIGASKPVTIGTGGAGGIGSGGTPGNGGDTLLGTAGALMAVPGGNSATAASGGYFNPGNCFTTGAPALFASNFLQAGTGGSPESLGQGGVGPGTQAAVASVPGATGANGVAGAGFGSGGSGAYSNAAASSTTGGAGAAGYIVITEYIA